MGKEGTLIQRSVDLIAQIFYLQLLWLIGTLIGGVVLGLFPATLSVYEVVRRWESEGFYQVDHPAEVFKETYKKEFKASNAFGWIFLGIGIFLYLDLTLASQLDNVVGILALAVFFVLTGLYILFITFSFPVLAHFEGTFWDRLRTMALLSVSSMGYVCLNSLISVALLGFFIIVLPAAIPFSFITIYAVINTKIVRKAIERAERMKEEQEQVSEVS